MSISRRYWQQFVHRRQSRGARSTAHHPYRSALERDYADVLAARQRVGEVVTWRYEALTLRLASGIRYTPDFVVELPDGGIELHEVKGWWREDAKIKFREAAAQWPCFEWVVVGRERGQWVAIRSDRRMDRR